MSKAGWLRIKKEMQLVESLLETEQFKRLTKTNQIRLLARRLAISDITAWRRIQRYDDYKKAVVLKDEKEIARLDWHEKIYEHS